MNVKQLTPTEVLEERISDLALKRHAANPKNIDIVYQMAEIAVVACYNAGAAGNVTCRDASIKLLKLQKQLVK